MNRPHASRPVFLLAALVALAALAGCFSDRNSASPSPWLPTDVTGLAFAKAPETRVLADGDTLVLEAAPVKKTLKGTEVRMWAYNGSIPGPIIQVRQGARVIVRLVNRTGYPTSLHAHGVRMENRADGDPGTTQDPVAHGDAFAYDLRFPDPGLFWYHAHVREDYSQELGLYGNIQVVPADSAYWRPVDRDQILMLDDFYLDTVRKVAPFLADGPDRTMMGRFGNVYLINGDTSFAMEARRKDLVRFWATNACNSRVLNLGVADPQGRLLPLKVVGGDNGQYEWFDTVPTVLLAPGERKIFEARLDSAGGHSLVHRILASSYNSAGAVVLGRVEVSPEPSATGHGEGFMRDTASAVAKASLDSVRALAALAVPPDKELVLTGTMVMRPARKVSAAANDGPISIEAKGIEWLDHMADMNAFSDRENMKWVIRDAATGLENHHIDWSFRRGQKVKIRIRNDTAATHPMPHPIHFHGQRFLVTAVNGRRNLNMAWKDTYLVGTRETVDLLLDASNPGRWMAHCHIAEHLEAMMMFHFTVE